MDEKYQRIIEITQEIRTELATDLADKIAFGEDPGDIKGELSTLGIIVGQCAGVLIKHDKKCIAEIPGKDKYVNIILNGIKYPVLKEYIPGFAEYHLEVQQNEIPKKDEVSALSGGIDSPVDYPKKEEKYNFEEEDKDEDEDEDEESSYIPEEEEPEEEENEEVSFIETKAKVIGGNIPNISGSVNGADVFIEEKTKRENEFVLDTYRINIAHAGCKAEEMYFTIAPLKICRMGSANVPIVVSIYYKGKTINVSSYDKRDNNRVMVSVEVNEYYFLCRGWFTDNGEFKSSISTTGLSSDTGDRLNILSKKEYHNIDNLTNIKNGHIKFNYTGDQGNCILEIFPLDLDADLKDRNEYLIMNRNGEFVEYYIISKGRKGTSRAILWNADGEKSEIVCNWNGDQLEADVVPM